MKGLSGKGLQSFHERVLGTEIRIFGNVAVALAAAEMIENDTETSRSVEMMLLVRSEGAWRIVSQAWDRETEAKAIPSDLTGADPA